MRPRSGDWISLVLTKEGTRAIVFIGMAVTSMQEQQPQVIPTSPLEGCFASALSVDNRLFLQQQPYCRAPGKPAAWLVSCTFLLNPLATVWAVSECFMETSPT